MRAWHAQSRDHLFAAFHDLLEVLHLVGEVAHLVAAEKKDVGLVDRVEPVAINLVLFDDGLPQLLSLLMVGPGTHHSTLGVHRDIFAINDHAQGLVDNRLFKTRRGGQVIDGEIETNPAFGRLELCLLPPARVEPLLPHRDGSSALRDLEPSGERRSDAPVASLVQVHAVFVVALPQVRRGKQIHAPVSTRFGQGQINCAARSSRTLRSAGSGNTRPALACLIGVSKTSFTPLRSNSSTSAR